MLENITISENISMSIPLPAAPFDTVTVSENIKLSIPLRPNVFDSVTASESFNTNTNSRVSVFDSVSVTDSLGINDILLISVSDTVTVSEFIHASAFDYAIEVGEDISVSEDYAPDALGVYAVEEISVSTILIGTTISGFQMPLSRPQGSLKYAYEGGGSTLPQDNLIIGGGL